MPNLLNIAELTRLLESAPKDSDHVHTIEELQAHFLATHGVIAPAALTDDEAVKIGADAVGNVPTEPAEIAPVCPRRSRKDRERRLSQREVRVRPRYAKLYPELATDRWVSAREFAELIVLRARTARSLSIYQRTLDRRHFESG